MTRRIIPTLGSCTMKTQLAQLHDDFRAVPGISPTVLFFPKQPFISRIRSWGTFRLRPPGRWSSWYRPFKRLRLGLSSTYSIDGKQLAVPFAG